MACIFKVHVIHSNAFKPIAPYLFEVFPVIGVHESEPKLNISLKRNCCISMQRHDKPKPVKYKSERIYLKCYLLNNFYRNIEINVTHNSHFSFVYLLGITRPTTTQYRIENRLYIIIIFQLAILMLELSLSIP